MGHPTNLRSIPRDHKYGGTAERSISPCIRQGPKLQDMLMSEQSDLSYAYFLHEISKGPDVDMPKHSRSQEGQVLEKGKNFQEKALNAGVIDRKRFEKWRCSKKQSPDKYTGYSPSSSNTFFSSADCSSSHFQEQSSAIKGPNCTPSQVEKVYAEGKLEAIGVLGRNTKGPMETFGGTTNKLIRQPQIYGVSQEGERKETELIGMIKLQDDRPAKQAPRLRETKSNSSCRDHCRREKSEDLSPSRNDTRLESTGYCYVKSSSQASNLHHTKMSSQDVKAPRKSYSLPFPARRFSSPSRSRNTEEKKPISGQMVVSAAKCLEELDVKKSLESISKARNPSPIRRLSFAVSKMIKNAGSRESSPLRKSNSSSKDGVAKSLPERSSSPLRRLFDPLLKPRDSNSPEPSKRHSSPAIDAMKLTSSRDSHPSIKNGSSSLQALLRVSFKNGLPLFTFAIDNESNILAATVRKSYVPGKGQYTWTYTFFTVREIKRKSGIWLNNNQGENREGHGYVPNVVAQMKVSDSQENSDNIITREFGLFAVDIGGHGGQSETNFHPTNELAAIVVKLPRSITSGNPSTTYSWLDLPHTFMRDQLQCSNFSSTVILPGGIHTIPSKGEISTLVQRWRRSAGSCDCGGWDLGCQLQVYTNQIGYETKIKSSTTSGVEDKFQLFSQVGQLMLSLASFKERTYSVELSSSLPLLQAFAICISFIDCTRPAELSGPSIAVGNETGVFEAPRQYVSHPPQSPVGRV